MEVDKVKVTESKPLSHWTGQREFGFTYVRNGDHTDRVVDETQTAIVRRAYEMSDQGHGDLKIAKAVGLSKDRVRNILTSTLYDGRVLYGTTKNKVMRVQPGETITRGGRVLAVGEKYDARVRAPKDDWQYGTAPRIVEHDPWERVQARRKAAAAHFARTEDGRIMTKPEGALIGQHIASSIGRCPDCGGPVVFTKKNATNRRYYCSAHTNGGACPNGAGIPAKALDQSIRDRVIAKLEEDGLWDEMLAACETLRAKETVEAPARESYLAEVAKLETEIERLVSAIASGLSSADVVAAINAKRAQVEALRSKPVVKTADLDEPAKVKLFRHLRALNPLLRGDAPAFRSVLRKLGVKRDGKGGYTWESSGRSGGTAQRR